jgi:hypothetical protein
MGWIVCEPSPRWAPAIDRLVRRAAEPAPTASWMMPRRVQSTTTHTEIASIVVQTPARAALLWSLPSSGGWEGVLQTAHQIAPRVAIQFVALPIHTPLAVVDSVSLSLRSCGFALVLLHLHQLPLAIRMADRRWQQHQPSLREQVQAMVESLVGTPT